MKPLETKRLIIRNWLDADQQPFCTMNQDNDVMYFFPKLLSNKESLDFIEKNKISITQNNFGFFALELKETHEFIGFCGLQIPSFQANFTPCTEIGWRLAKKFWSQGLASEAAQEILHYAFRDLALKTVVSFTTKQNEKSIKVMEKIGMQHDLDGDFYHPSLPREHWLAKHVLYKIHNTDCQV